MHRRFLLTTCRTLTVTLLALSSLACNTLTAQPRFTVSKDQLQQVVAKRFPMRYPVVGLLDLAVQAPEIQLMPEKNRLSATPLASTAMVAFNRFCSGNSRISGACTSKLSSPTTG